MLGLSKPRRKVAGAVPSHAERAAQVPDAQVIGAEVVAPLRDAMRLVHGDQGGVDAAQERQGGRRGQPFGRHIEQFDAAIIQRLKHRLGFLVGVGGGEGAGLDPRFAQAADLVAHQGDERRDDDRHPVAAQGGQLKAQRLAAARGHDGQRVAPGEDGIDDILLPRAEAGKAEDRGEKGARVLHRACGERGARHGPRRGAGRRVRDGCADGGCAGRAGAAAVRGC